MDREASWATVHRVAKSRTWLINFHFSTKLMNANACDNSWLVLRAQCSWGRSDNSCTMMTTLILIILKLFKNAKTSYYEILLKWNGANVLCISLRQITLPQQYFSHVRNDVCVCACSVLSNSFVTLWTIARQVHLSMKFLRQEYWSGLPFPSPVSAIADI